MGLVPVFQLKRERKPMKGNKAGNSGGPWMVCLRIGSHGVVGGSRHFPSYEAADKARKDMIASPSVRAQKPGSVGVLVMHFKKFRELVAKDQACSIARIQANQRAMPDLAAISQASQTLDSIDTDRMQAYLKTDEKWKHHLAKHTQKAI